MDDLSRIETSRHYLRRIDSVWVYWTTLEILSWWTPLRATCRSKKLIHSLNCLHKGQKCIPILWGNQNLNFLLLKTTKTARCVRSLRKIPYFVSKPQRLFLATTEAKTFCAVLLRGPKKCKSLLRIRKQSLLRRKSAILSVRWKFHRIGKIILALWL